MNNNVADCEYDWEKVTQLVRQNFQLYLSHNEVFNRVVHDLFGETKFTQAITKFFPIIYKNPHLKWDSIKNIQLTMEFIGRVSEEIERLQTSIARFQCRESDRFCYLNDRYAVHFVCMEKQRKLFLLDIYHGATREFRIEGNFLTYEWSVYYSLEVIDLEHLLLVEHVHNSVNILLVRLNFAKSKCTLVTSVQLNTPTVAFIFDFNDRHRFLIWSYSDNASNCFQFAHIENNELFIGSRRIPFNRTMFYSRLEGTTLQAMTLNMDENEEFTDDYVFGEFNLLNGTDGNSFKKLFDVKYTANKEDINRPMNWFYTSTTRGYSSIKLNYGFDAILLHSFNLDDRKLRLVKSYFYLNGNIRDWNFNENKSVNVCINDKTHNEFVIHRLPLKHPDTLFNLAFFAIRRLNMFYGSKLYDNVLHTVLPASFRPFEICSDQPSKSDNLGKINCPSQKKRQRHS